MPTSFSPEGNGINEKYGPVGVGITKYIMKIFNRWGIIVYQTEGSKPWDGQYMHESASEGV